MNIFGITGWKNTGKTGLMERLVTHITAQGFSVSTLKHAHHSFDVDHAGKDSFRHRSAGAHQVLLSSEKRWALMSELRGNAEPDLKTLLAQMAPVDLILIEGWKHGTHPKIETWRAEIGQKLISENDDTICAIAADTVLQSDRPVFDLNDTDQIARFILKSVGLG